MTPEQVLAWALYSETSPLYAHLCEVIAADEELMRVLERIEHTPEPNMLFAGVQFIMARDGGGDLEAHYPNFGGDRPIEGVARPFRAFVLEHEEELVHIGRTRYTQTNECRRCVALLPALWLTDAVDFHLLDLGASAGLNLAIDRYEYRWDGDGWGGPSQVRLVTENRGAPVEPRSIEVLSRTGIDLHPVDPRDEEDRRWLEALIWPEHHERRERLRAALDIVADIDTRLVAGDALELLEPTIEALPGEEAVVVINSFVLNQLRPSERIEVTSILERCRARRAVYRVSMEALDPAAKTAALEIDNGGGLVEAGRAQPHGEWVELYARP